MRAILSLLVLIMLLVAPNTTAPERGHIKNYKVSDQIHFEHSTNRHIVLRGMWTIPPDIVVCDNVVSDLRIRRAVNFWERLGYSFGTVTKDNDPLRCQKKEIGKIKIMLPSSSTPMENNLAITNTERLAATNENITAVIIIHSFAVEKPLVLEHEIGHALGWLHTTKYGHLMNPQVERIGHDTTGLKYRDYIRLGQEIVNLQ